jgi:hypothetical protein
MARITADRFLGSAICHAAVCFRSPEEAAIWDHSRLLSTTAICRGISASK